MIRYINRLSGKNVETVDQLDSVDFATRKNMYTELNRLLAEYRLSDSSATYYISQRATKAWNS